MVVEKPGVSVCLEVITPSVLHWTSRSLEGQGGSGRVGLTTRRIDSRCKTHICQGLAVS
jgi:hypothetical protein